MENIDNVIHVQEATRRNNGNALGYTHIPATFTYDWVIEAVPARASYEQATRDKFWSIFDQNRLPPLEAQKRLKTAF